MLLLLSLLLRLLLRLLIGGLTATACSLRGLSSALAAGHARGDAWSQETPRRVGQQDAQPRYEAHARARRAARRGQLGAGC
jgi:hypothetical protein